MTDNRNASATKRGPGRKPLRGPGTRTARQTAAHNGGLAVVSERIQAVTRDMRKRLSGTKGLR